MRAKVFQFTLSLLIVVLVAATYWIFPSPTPAPASKTIWHYRMTVTVDTPEGMKVGSAVREVIYGGHTTGGGGPGMDLQCKGEAVVVDLGSRGILFGILRNWAGPDYCTDMLLRVFHGGVQLKPDSVPLEGKVTLTTANYPTFVYFRDITDPKTAEPVLEMGGEQKSSIEADHFEKIFGSGVSLKEITVEMTTDPVTKGIERHLAWLPKYYNRRLDGNRYGTGGRSDFPFANSLASGDFSTGD
jgi:hypothetical protein